MHPPGGLALAEGFCMLMLWPKELGESLGVRWQPNESVYIVREIES